MSLDAIAQQDTPLLTALYACAQRDTAPFHTPGHKRGRGWTDALWEWWGDRVGAADLPELPELDNLFAPSGVIAAAQTLAAAAFGAEQTWFLTNGSTGGILAAILATCQPGDALILPRNVHQSAISGMVLAGAMPIFVAPVVDPEWDLALGVTPAAIAAALAQAPHAKAVLIVSPTYAGVCADVAAITQVCHAHGVPLIVDEAHGAHFGFHADLPRSALQSGADIAVQSTHKVLSALTQAAMLHTQGTRIDRDRLSRCLSYVQSTSPNYLLLASLDAARQQMALHGEALMQQTLDLAQLVRSRLTTVPGLTLLSPPTTPIPGFADLDRTRLTVGVAGLGWDGFAADEWLSQEWGVIAELPTLRQLTFILTLGNTAADGDRLVQGLTQLATLPPPAPPTDPIALPFLPTCTQPEMTPRDAAFATQVTVATAHAIGQISAELVCPYPPGIPLLVPGERITAAAIAQLQQILAAGGVISGCADPSLTTLRIVQ